MNYYLFLKNLGINLQAGSGKIFYLSGFRSLNISIQLVLIRHGETYGNCGQCNAFGEIDENLVKLNVKNKEKRIFQGNVDSAINQLTPLGRQQGELAALELEERLLKKNWQPDLIFYSPLSRARETGIPFVERNHLHDRYLVHPGITEMSFGAWDNRRVCDLPKKHPAHLLYQAQHALVKESGLNVHGTFQEAECFCDVLIRAYHVIISLDKKYPNQKIILFSHSLFGAALSVLFGLCQPFEGSSHLAFDGKRRDGSYYTLEHAKPFCLNFKI